MNTEYLKKIPQWYRLDTTEYDTVLSDDIDGLISTALLRKIKGWNIGYFYDFNTLYLSERIRDKQKKAATRVWADVSVLYRGEKAFDNHVNRRNLDDMMNTNMINPNLLSDVTAGTSYNQKYAGSTALLIWSLYNFPLPKTEEGKMLLLCIDSTFKGFYDTWSDQKHRKANEFFLKKMFGLNELYNVQTRHSKSDFYEIIDNYDLTKKIRLKDGYLETDLDLEKISDLLGLDVYLPDDHFVKGREFTQGKINMAAKSVKELPQKILTLAFTYKHEAVYSCF